MEPFQEDRAEHPEPRALSSLMNEIRQMVRGTFSAPQHVVAEIAGLNTSQRGHLYFDLVERKAEKTLAKARGNLWAGKKKAIIERFERETRTTLKKGMQVLLIVKVEFHPVYGLSLMVEDIDPRYTLGEIERQKKETIDRLKREDLLEENAKRHLPPVLQRLAIISSPTAAGYQDLLDHLWNNHYGFTFTTTLFPAVVQGEEAPISLKTAFSALQENADRYDAILLIRGGGSSTDLSCFDEYKVARAIAQNSLPVISGIGHERDRSIADMVAHTPLKTPTAVANFIIDRNLTFESELTDIQDRIGKGVRQALTLEKERFTNTTGRIRERARTFLHSQHQRLQNAQSFLRKDSRRMLKKEREGLAQSARQIRDRVPRILSRYKERLAEKHKHIGLADPVNILKRGFSITTLNGAALQDVDEIREGDRVKTRLYRGSFASTVQTITTPKAKENERSEPNEPDRGHE